MRTQKHKYSTHHRPSPLLILGATRRADNAIPGVPVLILYLAVFSPLAHALVPLIVFSDVFHCLFRYPQH